MNTTAKKLLRSLPSVSGLLEHEEVAEWLNALPRSSVLAAVQSAIDGMRDEIMAGEQTDAVDVEEIIQRAEVELEERTTPSLRKVINATGIVLHTGLGRAPLCEAAIDAIAETASGYCNLEYDLEAGERGSRISHVADLIAELTGAEAATVLNNNAAATYIILHCFAKDRKVLVSRGQLVEIGGSFRLPEIMSAAGAKLCEVGTTNRTRLDDYEKAIDDSTSVILRIHPSNYRIVGFTENVDIADLAGLAESFRLIAVDDLGSGATAGLQMDGVQDDPTISASLDAGADLVCFSGDKLFGGPQCGIIVGRADLIAQINSDPLMRTYRVGKLTLAALEATLRLHMDAGESSHQIPSLAMLNASTDELADRARQLCEQLEAALPEEHFLVCSDSSFAGGGALPAVEFPTVVVQWRPSADTPQYAADCLREAEVPVVARIRDDAICFDVRTLVPADFEAIVGGVEEVLNDYDEEEEEEE